MRLDVFVPGLVILWSVGAKQAIVVINFDGDVLATYGYLAKFCLAGPSMPNLRDHVLLCNLKPPQTLLDLLLQVLKVYTLAMKFTAYVVFQIWFRDDIGND